MEPKRKSDKVKRHTKVMEANFWDCSVCTYRNNAEAFKCSMCDVRKGTSTRKPRLNSTLVAQQAAVKNFPSGSTSPVSSHSRHQSSSKNRKGKQHRRPAPRIKNIDRSTAQTREVTINSVTVLITEYLPKKSETKADSSESFSESNDSGG